MNQSIQKQEAAPNRFRNVAEIWPLYDTAIICSAQFGQEANVNGWFTSFQDFALVERHSFFTSRTEANAHLSYCNKTTADSMDFAFEANSIGVAFIAPGVRSLSCTLDVPEEYQAINTQIGHFWEAELPRMCSMEFKIQQDTILEQPAMAMSPGYGPVGGGASFENEQAGRQPIQGVAGSPGDYLPIMNMGMTQGVPFIKNRFPFPKPLKIPRTATIEGIITISEHAKDYLNSLTTALLDPQYIWGGIPTAPETLSYNAFPARFAIQMSLFGKRLVQQRAQYHR